MGTSSSERADSARELNSQESFLATVARAVPSLAPSLAIIGLAAALLTLVVLATGCASTPKAAKEPPKLSEMLGRKVALVDLEGEPTQRRMVEVALVNQLQKHGSFELVDRQAVDFARQLPGQDPTDWLGIARQTGADYALRGKVLQLSADEREGYDRVKVEDSQLAAERGESARQTDRLVKVKSLQAHVRIELEFTDLASGSTRQGIAEREDKVTADASQGAIRLPPRLSFLEKATNAAFGEFFEKYAN